MGESEGSSSEASCKGMPQVKWLKELNKLPVGSEKYPGQEKRNGRGTHDAVRCASLPRSLSSSRPLQRPILH